MTAITKETQGLLCFDSRSSSLDFQEQLAFNPQPDGVSQINTLFDITCSQFEQRGKELNVFNDNLNVISKITNNLLEIILDRL